MLKILPFTLALISIIYEFALAQLISTFHGSTFTVYAICVGIFTCSLGFGSLAFNHIKSKAPSSLLLLAETLLSVSALLAPFIIVIGTALPLPPYLKYFFVYSTVFFTGFLSGIELPCLLGLDIKKKEAILFWDYLGMFIGSLLFGLYALELFGPITLLWILSSLNCVAAIFFSHSKHCPTKSFSTQALLLSILILNQVCILNESKITTWFGGLYGF
ncbi:MAG: hypothetical protein ACRBBP_06420 [Bdellovibrionales bacterium]